MDSKFTGHIYHFLEKSAEFAKQQARKYLWERNANFYIPGTHGTWRHFMRRIDASMKGQESVWGPSVIPQMTPIGPKPPVKSPEVDKDEWGVGEEADLITFLPMFDPRWHEMAIRQWPMGGSKRRSATDIPSCHGASIKETGESNARDTDPAKYRISFWDDSPYRRSLAWAQSCLRASPNLYRWEVDSKGAWPNFEPRLSRENEWW